MLAWYIIMLTTSCVSLSSLYRAYIQCQDAKRKKWCRAKRSWRRGLLSEFEGRVWPKTTALEAAGAKMIGHQDTYASKGARPLLGQIGRDTSELQSRE